MLSKRNHSINILCITKYEVYTFKNEKLKREGGSIVQGQVFLKGGLSLFVFNVFKIYHFYM